MRNPAGASSWTHESVISVMSLSAHVGAFRGPLGKLGVVGGVWGFLQLASKFLRETLKRAKPHNIDLTDDVRSD